MAESTQSGESIQSRIESYLARQDAPAQPQETPPAEQEHPEGMDVQAEDQSAESEPAGDELPESEDALTTADLAEYLGIDESALDVGDDGSLIVRTKVDGEEGTATLKDLVTSYQLRGHLDKANQEVANLRKSYEQKLSQADSTIKAKNSELEGITVLALNSLMHEFNGIDWNQLRQMDAEEWSAKQIEFGQRKAQLSEALNYLQNQKAAIEGQEMAREGSRIPDLIPEWKDQATADKEKAELQAYMTKAGYSSNVVKTADGVALLRKAMMYDKLQGVKVETMKKVKTAPKLAKPGAAKSQTDIKQAEIVSIRKAIKKSGGKAGIADYLLRTGKV